MSIKVVKFGPFMCRAFDGPKINASLVTRSILWPGKVTFVITVSGTIYAQDRFFVQRMKHDVFDPDGILLACTS